MSNIDDQIAELSRQIQSLSESTIQHGQGFISSTPRGQGVRPKVVESKELDSGVVTTGPSLSTPVGLAVGDTLPLPDRDIITNPQVINIKYIGQDKIQNVSPKQESIKNQSTAHTVSSGSNDVKIKPSKYDGLTPWMDYLSHFEMCALVNMWSEHQKGLYLAVSLIGQAQSVLGDLPKEKRQIFTDLVFALEERFAPSSQTELYRVQFKERRQKASETLPELGQSVRRLSNLAYPTAPLELRDTLAKEQFLDALVDSEMRLRIKQSRPKGLNDTIRLAVELEAYNKAESRTMKSMGHLRQTTSDERTEASNSPDTVVSMENMATWMQTMENNLQSLTKDMMTLKDLNYQKKFQPRGETYNTQSNRKRGGPCFSCGEIGHFARNCPNKVMKQNTKGPDTDGSVRTLKSGEKVANKDKGAVISASEDAGMYVELLIQDIFVKFVVDTGATLTLVSNKVYDLIPDLYRPHLNATKDVVSTESVTIPARSEIVVSGKVCLSEGQTLPNNDVLVEASENKGKDYILTARSLVKSNDSIPVRLMNVENEAKTIFPGTTIAQMCEISHVAKSLPSQNDRQNKKGLRSDLHDLLNRTSDKLSRSEKQKVKGLVQEYESLFAETDSDLGHIISEDGIATDPEKIKVVQNWPVPTNPTEVRSFLGLCSYYRKFIKNFASIAKCLHVLTEKGKRFEWISDCQHAFDLLKIKLTNAPILTHPDFNKEFILDTDASNVGIRGVLSQRHEDGTQHRNADALSRIPCKQCGYTLDWQSKTSSDCHKTEESQVKIVTSQMPDHDTDWTLTDKQSNDPDLKLVKQWLTDGQRPLYNEVSGKGFFIRSLWSQFNSLELQDDLVFRHFYDNERKVVKLQAIIPLSERKQVLHYCHDAKYSGHLGMRKTLEKIRQSYYWPGLQADVRAYVAGCDKCAMRKTPTKKKRAPMAIVETSSPMERLATDILGELPETENGNRYILVVSDYYTKWTESFPMPNMEASTVVKIIVEEVIARFGVPSWIHSDQGRQYESRLFQEVCKVLDIKKTRTTPYHPQSDGMVERFNKTLATMLSAYVQEHQRDWDKYIPFVMMAYRASEHDTTGQTPNRLMFGRESTTPLDILYEMPPSIKGIPQHKWAWELKERLEDAHSFVRQRMPGEMRRQKRYHDLKLSYESFRSGDQVYVYFPVRKTGKSPKLTCFWRGPFTILEKSGDLTYKVDCGIRGTPQIIHVDRIKLKHKQVLRGEMYEDIDNPQVTEPREADIFDDVIDQDDRIGIEEESGRRERKRPVWMADYILD
ncbi:unnamed protein product [Mytilus edulis]|uniref:Uncharacterized protein n=1 Tax=Mytilus edulis TaxID=6550 RepID=A0A8S3RTW6_MYTED|nr:unnamed protein product [Mytilus edulis]